MSKAKLASKRILEVKIKHVTDEHSNGEDSIGTFDNEAKSEYAIKVESCEGYRFSGYAYYNAPIENYEGVEPDELREYVQQDYKRMLAYNAGEWDYIGVIAEAKIGLPSGYTDGVGSIILTTQTIKSGGLWGIESDAGDYLPEVESEQLAELKSQLKALGFSTRAIATAFKSAEREGR